MSPTTLLADPAVRLAGARFRPRVRRPAAAPRWVLGATALLLAAAALGYLRAWPPLATVMSASMEPTIKTGDMVVLKRLDRPARVGDVVSIKVPDDARARLGYPPVVIHRITRIHADGTVTTKGDARKEVDAFTIERRALTTRVVATLPAGGRVLAFLGSPLGLLWLIGGGVMLIALPLVERHRDGRRHEQDGLQATLEALTQELDVLRHERGAADAALRRHVEQLPALIERAVASALAAYEPPPPPPAPRFVAASQWRPPTPEPMAGTWDDPPPTRRFRAAELQPAEP